MSTIGSYTTRQFSETQKFLVLDPSTQSTSLVSGSSLIEYIQPRLNSVIAESTRVAAQNTDYKVGSIIQTSGATTPGDNFASTYLVVEGGTGDFPMLNGNDLLVLLGDDNLRDDLLSEASGKGASLVSMEGGPSVEEAITQAEADIQNRVIRVSSVADNFADYAASAQDGGEYTAVGYLPGIFAFADPTTRGGGEFVYVAGTPKSEHNGVTVISGTVPKLSLQAGGSQQERRDAFIAGTGETDPAGSGCFVRKSLDVVHSSWAGTFADKINDDTVALQASADAAQSTWFIDNGSHLTSAQITVDKRINIHGVGSERTSGLGSHIQHNGTGDALVFTDTVSVYDRTLRDFSVTSISGHALHIRYGCVRCEFLNLRLDSRSIDHSAIFGDYTSYGIGLFTNRFIGGEYFGSNTLTRNVPIVDLKTSATLINENVFRDMWISYSKGVEAIRLQASGGGVKLTNNKFESITFEVCEGGLLNLKQCAHTKIDGISAWDSPAYTADLVTLDACTNTAIIGFGRIGGVPDPGVVDLRNTGAGGGVIVINYSDVGAAGETIDWGGQTGAYIAGFSGSIVHQNDSRVIRLEGDNLTASNYYAPSGSDAWLRAVGNAEARLSSEHSGTARTISLDANSFYGGSGALRPDQNDILDLGASTLRWKTVHAVGYRANGSAGVSGAFTTADSKTVTVTNGIITSIV